MGVSGESFPLWRTPCDPLPPPPPFQIHCLWYSPGKVAATIIHTHKSLVRISACGLFCTSFNFKSVSVRVTAFCSFVLFCRRHLQVQNNILTADWSNPHEASQTTGAFVLLIMGQIFASSLEGVSFASRIYIRLVSIWRMRGTVPPHPNKLSKQRRVYDLGWNTSLSILLVLCFVLKLMLVIFSGTICVSVNVLRTNLFQLFAHYS